MLKEHILGQTGLAYLRDQLSMGGDYAKHVLSEFHLGQGRITTYLPEDLCEWPITNFEDSAAIDYQSMSSQSQTKRLDLISQLLARHVDSLLVVETFATNGDHPWVERMKVPYFTYSNSLYLFIPSNQYDRHLGQDAFRHGSAYPGLSYITKISQADLVSGSNVSPQAFLHMVNLTSVIFADAYDQDGFLVWERGAAA